MKKAETTETTETMATVMETKMLQATLALTTMLRMQDVLISKITS
jgi:hypothetical protein